MKTLELRESESVYLVEDISAILQSTQNLETFGMPRRMCSKKGVNSVVKLFPPKLPFLKRFYTRMEVSVGRRKSCPTFLEEFFTAAENVSSLHLDLDDYDDWVNLPGAILEVLQVLKKLGRESTLENLIISRVRVSHLTTLEIMASNGLKLKHLRILNGQMSLRVPGPDNIWLQVIKLFADSLVTLGVCYGGRSLTELPRMPHLKILDIHIPANGNLRCERIDFMNTFPILESLSMTCKGGHHVLYPVPPPHRPLPLYEFFNGDEICPNMKTLSLREGFDMTTNQTLGHALKIFPNLYELELKIESAELLQPIWVHMSGLEKLHLYGELGNKNAEKIDSLFTGIPHEVIKKIRDGNKYFGSIHLKSMGERREIIRTLIERHRTLPSISDLTSLRLLSLSIPEKICCDGWNSKYVTDLTGYLGIYFLKNLQELHVSNCEFSRSCTKILVEDLGLVSWNFKQSFWEDAEDRVSCKKPYDGIQRNKFLEFSYAY